MKAVMLFPNLRAEMARAGLTTKQLAVLAEIPYGTLAQRLSGRFDFTFGETLRIKAALGVDMPVEVLFQKV